MSSSSNFTAKQVLFNISFIFLSLFLLILSSTFRLNNHPILISFSQHNSSSYVLDFIERELQGNNEIKIGLVNIDDDAGELARLGETTSVHFRRVSSGIKWEHEIYPQWVDEQQKWKLPKCPDIPMPVFQDYGEFDVVVTRVPCGNEEETSKGIRDVFRLQVNFVVANLLATNGRKKDDDDRSVYVVFLGSCGPMWEIFRCEDLLKHEGDVWIYKPDLKRLKQKLMPVEGCQWSSPFVKQGKDLSKLGKPREAYVTVLHSSEAYVCGAIVLAQTIIKTNSTKDLVLLADDSISGKNREALKAVGWKIKIIQRIESTFAKKTAYNRWNYSKLRIWQLTEYDKVMLIDSDIIVLKNLDKYFNHPPLSAVRDNTDLFNSGLMLIEPSECGFQTLAKKVPTLYSYNGGDQGFLNEAFTWWNRWPMKFNHFKIIHRMKANVTEDELFESSYTIHYFGIKPWKCYRDYDCNWDAKNRQKFSNDAAHSIWWQVHDAMPRELQRYCELSESMDLKLKKMREIAKNGSFPDEHWKIKVMDPRQHRSSN